MSTYARIAAIRYHLPEQTLDNSQLASEMPGWTAEKITEKTGIETRHVVGPGECASDLGVAAARRLFEDGVCAPEDVDFLILCTQSPDHFLPTTACLMQNRLRLRRDTGAFDFNLGCSGFVYGLSVAKGLIETGQASCVLLVTAETYSKYLNPRDRSVRTIFGDAATATLIRSEQSDQELIGPFVFGTDGSGGGLLIVPAGASRTPKSPETDLIHEAEHGNWRSASDIFMNGPEVFNFTLRVVPETVESLLDRAGLTAEDVDLFVFHQANRFMLERLRAKLGIPEEKFPVHLARFGNTVSSTIPIALAEIATSGKARPGTRAMLVGFGVGLSWAATLARL